MLKTILLLFLMMISAVSNAGFVLESFSEAENIAVSSEKPILLILGSKDCVYCKTLIKTIEKGSLQNEVDHFVVCYIDIDKNPDLKGVYNVQIVPLSVIIDDKETKSTLVGFNQEKYKQWLNNYD